MYCCLFFTECKLSEFLIAGLLRMINWELEPKVFLFRAVPWTGNFRKGKRNSDILQPSLCKSAALLLKNTFPCLTAMQLITIIILYHLGIRGFIRSRDPGTGTRLLWVQYPPSQKWGHEWINKRAIKNSDSDFSPFLSCLLLAYSTLH